MFCMGDFSSHSLLLSFETGEVAVRTSRPRKPFLNAISHHLLIIECSVKKINYMGLSMKRDFTHLTRGLVKGNLQGDELDSKVVFRIPIDYLHGSIVNDIELLLTDCMFQIGCQVDV